MENKKAKRKTNIDFDRELIKVKDGISISFMDLFKKKYKDIPLHGSRREISSLIWRLVYIPSFYRSKNNEVNIFLNNLETMLNSVKRVKNRGLYHLLLNCIDVIDEQDKIIKIVDFLYNKFPNFKKLKPEKASKIIDFSVEKSKFETTNRLLDIFNKDVELSKNVKFSLLNHLERDNFNDVELEKVKNVVFKNNETVLIPDIRYNSKNVEGKIIYCDQGKGQVRFDLISKYSKESNCIKNTVVAYARTKDENNGNILYEVKKDYNGKIIIIYYKKGTTEENKHNNILIVADIDKENVLNFHFTEENIENPQDLKENIMDIINLDYENLEGFDSTISYLIFAPLLLKNTNIVTVVDNCDRRNIKKYLKESKNKTFIIDQNLFCDIHQLKLGGHNVQVLINNGKGFIFNSGDDNITWMYLRKLNNSNFDDTHFKIFEQKVGNCVLASKLSLVTFLIKYMKCQQLQQTECRFSRFKIENELLELGSDLARFKKMQNKVIRKTEKEEVPYKGKQHIPKSIIPVKEIKDYGDNCVVFEAIEKTVKSVSKQPNAKLDEEKNMELAMRYLDKGKCPQLV